MTLKELIAELYQWQSNPGLSDAPVCFTYIDHENKTYELDISAVVQITDDPKDPGKVHLVNSVTFQRMRDNIEAAVPENNGKNWNVFECQ